MKLLWGALLKELKHIADTAEKRGTPTRRVLCLVDEAGVTPIHELEKHIATANARGISFILAYQAKSQIAENHGAYNAETILNSLDSQLYLRQASLQTAEYVSRLLGDTSGFAHSQSEHQGQEISRATSEREVPLMTARQIMQLPDGRLIGFHRNRPPFQAEKRRGRAASVSGPWNSRTAKFLDIPPLAGTPARLLGGFCVSRAGNPQRIAARD